MRELPNTLTRLQAMLANGELTLQEAGRLQEEQFARRTASLGCVTHPLKPG